MFWRVDQLEAVPTTMDFSSSGGGQRAFTAIDAGGARLINAAELVDYEEEATQVQVCESCGHSRCAPGGWIAFRRVPGTDEVAWLPAWDRQESEDHEEYRPPSFLEAKGVPVMSAAAWETARDLARLPPSDTLPLLSTRDAARWIQRVAPGGLLGEFPAPPQLNPAGLDAVIDGDLQQETRAVDELLRSWMESPVPVRSIQSRRDVLPIEFVTGVLGSATWAGFGRVEGRVCVVLDREQLILDGCGL